MEFLNSCDLIHKSQSGFRAAHSTESALLLMTERWLKAINEGKVVGSVMVDFRKAFDLVDHALLLEKLSCYKVSDKFFKLMKSYLNNRTQVVSINNEISNEDSVKCGVPQGSILGPILFLIFINDLPLFLSDTVSSTDLYADDTTIYDAQYDFDELKKNLQKSLIALHIWCKKNGMLLNTDKTKVMIITTRQKRLHLDENILTLSYNDTELQITTGDKILGVNIDENLTWNNHYQFVCRKISSYIWLLSRISRFLSNEHRLLYYKSYIQPHFNYCNVIWGNASNSNVTRMNRLQIRACKLIHVLGNEYDDFESAKATLNILSFEQSVFVSKAKIMYKVANGLVQQYICDLFTRRSEVAHGTSLRSITNQNFAIPKPKLTLYKESISYSGPVIWNNIPNDIRYLSNVSSFSKIVSNWITSM